MHTYYIQVWREVATSLLSVRLTPIYAYLEMRRIERVESWPPS